MKTFKENTTLDTNELPASPLPAHSEQPAHKTQKRGIKPASLKPMRSVLNIKSIRPRNVLPTQRVGTEHE